MEALQITLANWSLVKKTNDEQQCMGPLFSFVLKQFLEVFGREPLEAEQCVVYNDSAALFPMLITNRNPIVIRTCAATLQNWAQYIYQLSHELTHYVIRQYKTDKDAIVRWLEETLCEAMSLYILRSSSLRWKECLLSSFCPNYCDALSNYADNAYNKTAPSVLKKCHTLADLRAVDASCETRRIDRSIERNYLLDTFLEYPENISSFVLYPLYICGDLQIDFSKWKEVGSSPIVSALEAIQPELSSLTA